MRLRSGIAAYFARIDLHFELGRPNFAGPRKKRPECVCAKTATAAFAHTHPLNYGFALLVWLEIKIPISSW